jgi:predicted metalloprotease with PDZ domain
VLKQYDYENEQYVRELWIAEGITSYFDDLLVLRAGLCNESEFLARLSKTVHTVIIAPGRNVQSLEDSSFDTWIKHYRPDENANNSRISYYTKGACVAWLLDVLLAKTSNFKTRLDDVMRELWKRNSSTGYTNDLFETLVADLVPYDWQDWFDEHVRGVGELDFSQTLEFLGLRLKAENSIDRRSATDIAVSVPDSTTSPAIVEIASLGCDIRDAGGRIVVDRIMRGGAASSGDLRVDDEILAINSSRVSFATFDKILQYYRVGEKLTLTITRRELIQNVELTLQQSVREWKLEIQNEADETLAINRRRWLSGK